MNYRLQSGGQARTFLRLTIFVAPLLILTALVALKLESWQLYWRIAAVEDGPVEYMTSFCYLIAFAFALSTSIRFLHERKRSYGFLSALFAAGCIFVAFEEISWGQRIFGVATPPVLESYNTQGELNLHNIAGRYVLHAAYILAGGYGAFAFLFLPRRLRSWGDDGTLSRLLVPDWWLMLYFLPVFLLYLYYDYLSLLLVGVFGEAWGWDSGRGGGRFMISKDQEPAEFIMSLGVALFAGTNKVRQANEALQSIEVRKGR